MPDNMPTDIMTLTLLLALGLYYALKAIAARDVALSAADRACRHAGVQLLDRSVAQERIRLRRDNNGRLCLYRRYRFEFSSDGSRRYNGVVELLAGQVLHLELEPHRIPL